MKNVFQATNEEQVLQVRNTLDKETPIFSVQFSPPEYMILFVMLLDKRGTPKRSYFEFAGFVAFSAAGL